jgi:hypothetical protein
MNTARLSQMGVRVVRVEDMDQQQQQQDHPLTKIKTFVIVPASPSLPLQELCFVNDAVSSEYVDTEYFDTIQEDDGTWLEPYFQLVKGIEYIDMTKLQEQAVANREAGCATGMCPHVSPATLQRAAEAGTVERMELSLVKKERNNQNEQDSEPEERSKVYLYWDESAHLKQRPLNERAKQLLSTTTTTNIHANGTRTGDGAGILGDRTGGSSMSNIYGDAFLIRFTSPQQQQQQQQQPTLEDAISNLPTRQHQIILLSQQEIESNL